MLFRSSFESHPLRQPFIVVDEAITGTEYHGIKTGCRVSGIHAAKPFYLPAQPVKAGSDVFALPGKFQIQPGPGIHFQGGGKIALAYCRLLEKHKLLRETDDEGV